MSTIFNKNGHTMRLHNDYKLYNEITIDRDNIVNGELVSAVDHYFDNKLLLNSDYTKLFDLYPFSNQIIDYWKICDIKNRWKNLTMELELGCIQKIITMHSYYSVTKYIMPAIGIKFDNFTKNQTNNNYIDNNCTDNLIKYDSVISYKNHKKTDNVKQIDIKIKHISLISHIYSNKIIYFDADQNYQTVIYYYNNKIKKWISLGKINILLKANNDKLIKFDNEIQTNKIRIKFKYYDDNIYINLLPITIYGKQINKIQQGSIIINVPVTLNAKYSYDRNCTNYYCDNNKEQKMSKAIYIKKIKIMTIKDINHQLKEFYSNY